MKKFVVNQLIVEFFKENNLKMRNYDLNNIELINLKTGKVSKVNKKGFFVMILTKVKNESLRNDSALYTETIDLLEDLLTKMTLESQIKVSRIMDTSYGENDYGYGSKWIEYKYGEKLAYEIIDENELEHLDELDLITLAIKNEKHDLSSCSPLLQNLIESCRQSDCDMYFVEDDEITEKEKEELAIELSSLGDVDEYIEIDNECAVTVFGGVITKFLF